MHYNPVWLEHVPSESGPCSLHPLVPGSAGADLFNDAFAGSGANLPLHLGSRQKSLLTAASAPSRSNMCRCQTPSLQNVLLPMNA